MADRRPTLTDGLAGRSVASRLVVACSASYQSLLPPVTVPYIHRTVDVGPHWRSNAHSHDTYRREPIRDTRRTVHTALGRRVGSKTVAMLC